jgi:hypothetical protein
MDEPVPPQVAQRNLEMGAVFIKLLRDDPPLWHGLECPHGTVHTKAIEIGLRLGDRLGHRLYMDMKEDDRFVNPTHGNRPCYGLASSGEAWADRLLEEHAVGKKPWLLSWKEPAF